jgi:NitT/TauT family transport system substrate-binding protein
VATDLAATGLLVRIAAVRKSLPYNRWRENDAEDTLRFHALRLHALRLHQVGMIKTNPSKLIAQSTNWRLLNELKKELKG